MIKLLIVDDETTTRKGLKECISWHTIGVDCVEEAEDGAKALEVSLSFHPDIVLTDVKMPRMNGIELARNLKEIFPRCKFVFLSGYSDKEYLLSAIHLQAINYVEKPVDLTEVSEVIKKTVALIKEEQKKQEIEKENLCLEIIKHKSSPETLHKRLQEFNCLPKEGTLMVCVLVRLIPSGRQGPANLHDIKPSLFEVLLNQSLKSQLCCLCALKDEDYLIVTLFGSTLNNQTVQHYLGSIKEEILKIFHPNAHLSAGVGKIVSSPERLSDSYQTAFLALQRMFFKGYNQIISYQDQASEVFDFEKHDSEPFMKAILAGNKNQTVFFIKSVANELRHCPNTLINNIKNYFFNLLVTLSKLSEDRGVQLIQLSNKEEFFWDVISKSETLSDIEDYLIEKIDVYFSSLDEKEKRNSIVFNITKYIHENYHQLNLSIKSLSDYAFLTPNYLCLLFKKEVGKTINQYITEIRMEKAKELLKNRKVKLYEVSQNVGFSDANYFAKLFKKMEGLNPSEYREKYFS